MSTGLVILAAGESKRMGEPKQLLAYRGSTILHNAIDAALSLPDAPVVVVLGAHAAQIRTGLNDPRLLIAENPDWREGMGGSLRTGLSALLTAHPEISAVIFLLCDQPLLCVTTLHKLIATHERTGCAIVASEYAGALGVPALFARSMFPKLLTLQGETGARQLIRSHLDRTIGVPFQAGADDIDTPSDYRALRELSPPIPV